MAESEELSFLTSNLIKQEVTETEENETKVSETDEKTSEIEEKETKVSQTEEKASEIEEKETKESLPNCSAEVKLETEENGREREEKVMQKKMEVSQDQAEEIVSKAEKKVNEAEDKVTEKKAKVTFKLCLDEGDDSSTCSDRSFDVNTDSTETSAQLDGNAIGTNRKKGRRRLFKGGLRHKDREYYERCRDNFESPQLSQRALHLQEKDQAAAVSRYSDEQHLMLYPTAPFNSTQFLMEDQYKNSPQEDTDKWLVNSASNSPKHQSALPLSPSETNHDAIHFLKRDQEFTDSLNSVQAESLQSLPKEELVKHFMHLEEKMAALHKQVTEAELERKQEQDDDEDVYSKEGKHVQKPYVYESVYNSETNSLSSNNEEFLDLSKVNQVPVCVEESSVFVSDSTVSSTNFSSSESSS